MIAHLNGNLVLKKAPWIVMDVAGIGYEVQIPMTVYFALPDLNQMLHLWTHFVVREDAHSLYGFLKRSDRDLFREIIRVSGIGPKVGLSILSTMPASEFIRCVEGNLIQPLTQVPGIGKKTAERLLIELRDRMKNVESDAPLLGEPAANMAQSEAIQALMSLGYSVKEAKLAVSKAPVSADCETILRGALQGFVK